MVMLIVLITAFWATVFLTGSLRRYALAGRLLDVPNARSSHETPTPRGGGVAFVGVFLLVLPLFYVLDLIAWNIMWAIAGAGSLVAVVGFMDDHRHVPAQMRLAVHFGAAMWVLFWLGGVPPLNLADISISSGLGGFLGLFYLVWVLNLYNFMDGIDGLASIEAISVCLGGVVLYGLSSGFVDATLILLAVCVAGFLYWNFPPAQMFMGDVGSGFLGMLMGIFSLQAAWFEAQFFWSWLILLGVFIVDATWTLVHRACRGEKVYQGHCSHAYQRAARRYRSHKAVSLAVAAVNIAWLLPIAIWVGVGGLPGVSGVCLAYCPLMVVAVIFKAGSKEAIV